MVCFLLRILGYIDHFITAAPMVKPAPNAVMTRISPFFNLPAAYASVIAIGIEADEVLPYFSRLINTFSGGSFILFAMDSIILIFAWWGITRMVFASPDTIIPFARVRP